MSVTRLEYLFSRYCDNTATPAEKKEFIALLQTEENDEAIKQAIDQLFHSPGADTELDNVSAASIFEAVLHAGTARHRKKGTVIPLIVKAMTTAVSIVLVIGLSYWWMNPGSKREPPVPQDKPIPALLVGNNKTTIVFADGHTISVDTLPIGQARETSSAVSITKVKDGVLLLNSSPIKPAYAKYYSIVTPRGGQYQVQLQDGSTVWLGAASSIRIPTDFGQQQRSLELIGEAYFTVSKKQDQSFTVRINPGKALRQLIVEVLGTSFNINAYADEPVVKTFLVSGSLQLKKGAAVRTLYSGQQATTNTTEEIQVQQISDGEDALSWLYGLYKFTSTDIQSFMRHAKRWYGIDVKYRGKVPTDRFSGTLPFTVSFAEWLKALDAAGIAYTLNGHTVVIQEK